MRRSSSAFPHRVRARHGSSARKAAPRPRLQSAPDVGRRYRRGASWAWARTDATLPVSLRSVCDSTACPALRQNRSGPLEWCLEEVGHERQPQRHALCGNQQFELVGLSFPDPQPSGNSFDGGLNRQDLDGFGRSGAGAADCLTGSRPNRHENAIARERCRLSVQRLALKPTRYPQCSLGCENRLDCACTVEAPRRVQPLRS
jgi:hypothetical protein